MNNETLEKLGVKYLAISFFNNSGNFFITFNHAKTGETFHRFCLNDLNNLGKRLQIEILNIGRNMNKDLDETCKKCISELTELCKQCLPCSKTSEPNPENCAQYIECEKSE